MNDEALYLVQVVHKETNRIETSMGPMLMRRAQKVKRGVEINMNHDEYRARIVRHRQGGA